MKLKQTRRALAREAERRDRADRRLVLAIAIEKDWTSLRSHLADAVKCKVKGENENWHAQCCLDYATTIWALARELCALAKIDFPEIVESANRKI